MIYVYAIVETPPDGPLPSADGFADVAIRFYPINQTNFAGACSPDPPKAATPTAENLWRHEQVVEARMGGPGRAPLPVRYGTPSHDEHALVEALQSRAG